MEPKPSSTIDLSILSQIGVVLLQRDTRPTHGWSIGTRLETLKDPIRTACGGRIGRIVKRCSTTTSTGMIAVASFRVVLVQTGSTVEHFGCGWCCVDVPSPLWTFNPTSGSHHAGTSRRMVMMMMTTGSSCTVMMIMMMTAIVVRSCGHP